MIFEDMLKKLKKLEKITRYGWDDDEFIYLDTIIVNEDSPIEEKILIIYKYKHLTATTTVYNFTTADLFNDNWYVYGL